MRPLIFAFAALALLAGCAAMPSSSPLAAPDLAAEAHLWLEDVEGEAALDWVRARNAKSLAALQGDARYARFEAAALEIVRSKDRLTFSGYVDGYVSDFWQDDRQVRGLWRRALFDGWRAGAPAWEPILDVDALAAAESKNWVWKGAAKLEPETWATRALVSLSDGGKDATVVREFDVAARRFVEGGFALPEAKQIAAWEDADTLLVATDWGEGSLTESGYPFIVKRLKRGQALAQAQEVFRGDREDALYSFAFRLDDGARYRLFLKRYPTFFTSETHWLGDDWRAVRLNLPGRHDVVGLQGDRVLFTTQEAWTIAGRSLPAGGLYAATLSSLAGGGEPDVETIYRPGEREALQGANVAQDGVYVALTKNVRGAVRKYARGDDGAWTFAPVPLPEHGVAGVADASQRHPRVFFTYTDFITPPSVLTAEPKEPAPRPVQTQPPLFDATGLVVDQFEATSKDGTRVPYFIVRRADAPLDGTLPTLLYAYGGFEIALLPSYSGTTGKLWLEQGGAYVFANIRGGGEFGPDWHQAGLKTKRQVIYDDFIAVAEDLIARKITSPRRLGIMGGSNGGLLMGVILNQRPELFNAAVIQVPLLDMLRYHLLLAGASWVDEYGSPEVPEERAFLEAISPYHNLRRRADFPPPFIVTSTKDDRVHPGHARKYAARLEDLGLPYFYYENIDGGHSAAANLVEAAKRRALEFTYLSQRLMGEAQ